MYPSPVTLRKFISCRVSIIWSGLNFSPARLTFFSRYLYMMSARKQVRKCAVMRSSRRRKTGRASNSVLVSLKQSCKCPSSFSSYWTVIKERSPTLSCFLLSYDDKPPSVQTTTFDKPNSSLSFSSKGLSVVVSAVFPGLTQNACGIPSMSVNSPIWAIGFGLFSFEWPYCLMSCDLLSEFLSLRQR